MIRTRTGTAGTRALLVGLAVAAIASGTAAAAMPAFGLRVQARLAPVGGTTAAGHFDGTIAKSVGQAAPALPRQPMHWRLSWSLRLPALQRSAEASLRVAGRGAAPVVHVLCRGCGTRASGTMMLSPSQVFRIAQSDGVVLVRTPSATLRGPVRVVAHIAVSAPN